MHNKITDVCGCENDSIWLCISELNFICLQISVKFECAQAHVNLLCKLLLLIIFRTKVCSQCPNFIILKQSIKSGFRFKCFLMYDILQTECSS